MAHYYESVEERELRALRAMSVECLTPEERERAWRDLVAIRPLRALGHLVGAPWPPEPE